jgi:hypothetical protein
MNTSVKDGGAYGGALAGLFMDSHAGQALGPVAVFDAVRAELVAYEPGEESIVFGNL